MIWYNDKEIGESVCLDDILRIAEFDEAAECPLPFDPARWMDAPMYASSCHSLSPLCVNAGS
jgi:hypothetical protein